MKILVSLAFLLLNLHEISKTRTTPGHFYVNTTINQYKESDKVWFLNDSHKDGKLSELN